VRRKLRQVCFGKLQEVFGGRIRLLWTGMAPIRRDTLSFFREAGLSLYEAYAVTESGMIAANTPEHDRIGSVGKPVIEGSVQLGPDGQIILDIEHPLTTGYYECEPGENEQVFLSPTRIATDDIGYFDEDGFLFLKGRKNEIIVTKEGQKIHPEVLERQLSAVPGVLRSVVFGNHLPRLVAVIVTGAGSERQQRTVQEALDRINRELPIAFRIEKFLLTQEEFSVDNGLLTRNLKINRKAIFARYASELTAR